MWDIAEEFGAMLVFAEHRYYGDSLPFGEESKSKDPTKVCEGKTLKHKTYLCFLFQVGYLSSSQALADFVDLITSIRQTVEGAAVRCLMLSSYHLIKLFIEKPRDCLRWKLWRHVVCLDQD